MSWAYRAWVPRGSGTYIGFPGSSATLRAAGTACQSPDWVAILMVALADGLLASSVMPRSLRLRTWPRSTTRLPVHAPVHQSVPASPSIAFDAGFPDSVESALACPDSAQLTAGTLCGPAAPACGDTAEPERPAISGRTSRAGTAVSARCLLNPCRLNPPRIRMARRETARRDTASMMISVLHKVAGRVPGPAGMSPQASGLPWCARPDAIAHDSPQTNS